MVRERSLTTWNIPADSVVSEFMFESYTLPTDLSQVAVHFGRMNGDNASFSLVLFSSFRENIFF